MKRQIARAVMAWAWLGGYSASGWAAAPACGGCHAAQAARFPATPMALALEPVAQCAILKNNAVLEFKDGIYSHRIVREGGRSLYSVTDGKETLTVPLQWAFGRGVAGQTYVFEREGAWFETRVSYYLASRGLDLTLGAHGRQPRNLEEAAGRRMTNKDAKECFGCHATGLARQSKLDLTAITPGLQCEACHQNASAHEQAMRAGQRSAAPMKSLARLTTEEQSDFCGSCHRTWAQIASEGPRGVMNVRFQPYRLTNSKCYDATDARIRCAACHDPHQEVVRETSFYDAKCKACHAAGEEAKAGAKLCPRGQRDCASCHMPKYDLPGSHFSFTDHQIRIARPHAPYPN